MTEVLLHSPSSSSPSNNPSTTTLFDSISSSTTITTNPQIQQPEEIEDLDDENNNKVNNNTTEENNRRRRDHQLSLIALLVTIFRKSFWLAACKTDTDTNFTTGTSSSSPGTGNSSMEISWPTDVQHVNHVTFDRFDGFLGLPVEFEPEVSRRAPSASTRVFGVSTESMQLSYDIRGNSVPTILLLMQRHLYTERGLQAEGIFRLTAGNSQEEYVRDQLNRGVVPEGIDVHCLAGLIKAWFRELPRGVLDPLSPEQVMQCQSEADCESLVRLLPPTESALLNWAINLMADVVQEERLNKMNARNIAMVFAPNMTQMADPLTALMYAVQVMNFLKMLIERTLRERLDSIIEPSPVPHMEPSDDNGHQNFQQIRDENPEDSSEETILPFVVEDPGSDRESETLNHVNDNSDDEDFLSYSTSAEESDESEVYRVSIPREGKRTDHSGNMEKSDCSNQMNAGSRSDGQQAVGLSVKNDNMSNKGVSNLSRINSMTERFEAWR